MPAQYCPHHGTCPFYKNWTEKTGDKRTDVIIVTPTRAVTATGDLQGVYYDCLTLMALDDPATEGGITMTDELKSRLSNSDERDFDCSYLGLLNRLNDLEIKINELLKK